MTSLLDAAASLRAKRAEELNRCPVGRFRSTLSEQEQADFDHLLALPAQEMPSRLILDALAETGHDVRSFEEAAMQSHRRALRGGLGCKCPR